MTLKLNTEPYKAFPEEGTAPNIEQMQKLIAEGRVPMSVSGFMQKRLDVRNSDADVKSFYMDNWFDTGDAVVYHPDGRVKIVLDSQTLRSMTPESPRNGGALILTAENYDALQGEEFKKGKLGKTGDWLSRADVKSHPVWKVLARDQALLNDYTDYIFTEGKHDTAMGIFPGSANGETPEIRAWCVDGLGDRSDAGGGYGLDSDDGRLLGIAPEALDTKIVRPTLEQTLTVGSILEETGHTSAFAPDQIKKLQNIFEQKGYQIQKK